MWSWKIDLVLIIADKPSSNTNFGWITLEMARRMNLINPNEFCFRWVVDFSILEYNEEEKRYVSNASTPFTTAEWRCKNIF